MRAYERLLKYIRFPSVSDENSTSFPSTDGQWDIARYLKVEMEKLSFSDVYLNGHCCLYGVIPSNIKQDVPVVGFLAHMDVSPASPCEGVHPRIINTYDGCDIKLSDYITMNVSDFPILKNYIGKSLMVTDGTTLLGGDDKAGIAEIMTMAEKLLADNSVKHGKIAVAFTPDEEVGRGTNFFDLKRFGADFAYTVDGDEFGQIAYENFNASTVLVNFTGRSVHPGSAKNIMINAQIVAMEFFVMLPPQERPEHTEGYEGFFMLEESSGTIEQAFQKYILRDHDEEKLRRREDIIKESVLIINNSTFPVLKHGLNLEKSI